MADIITSPINKIEVRATDNTSIIKVEGNNEVIEFNITLEEEVVEFDVTLENGFNNVGRSAYESYLETTTDNPPLSQIEWARPKDNLQKRITDIEVVSNTYNLTNLDDNFTLIVDRAVNTNLNYEQVTNPAFQVFIRALGVGDVTNIITPGLTFNDNNINIIFTTQQVFLVEREFSTNNFFIN